MPAARWLLALVSGLWLHPTARGDLHTLPPDPQDGITQEIMDLEEHNRKQGYAAGVTGEYFRYKHVFYKQPSEKDREEAISIGSKIRCDVCVTTVESLLKKAATLSEDDIADVLEGNADYEMTGEPVHDRMLEHKKGCNKHFKDELIAKGWTLRVCKDVVPGRNDSEPCLYQEGSKPSERAVDSYEQWKECLFYACEQTVSRFSDGLAAHLAETLPSAANRSLAVRSACETVARCAGGPAPGAGRRDGAPPGGGARGEAPPKKSRRSRKRRRRRTAQSGEL